MENIKPYVHKVQYYETDRMQITHHSNYIRFMEEARLDFLEQAGWGYDKMESSGIISPVVSVSCDYRRMTTYNDVIEISVKVLEFSGVKLKLSYTMSSGGLIVCTASSVHCFLDREGKPVSMKKSFPAFYDTINSYIC